MTCIAAKVTNLFLLLLLLFLSLLLLLFLLSILLFMMLWLEMLLVLLSVVVCVADSLSPIVLARPFQPNPILYRGEAGTTVGYVSYQ